MAVERVSDVLEPPSVKALEQTARLRRVGREPAVQAAKEQRTQARRGIACPKPSHLVLLEDVVAAEQLVSPFAGQHDLESGIVHRGGEVEKGNRSRSQQRLLGELDDPREGGGDRCGVHGRSLEVDTELTGHSVLLRALVELSVREANPPGREHAPAQLVRGERGELRRIEPAAQVRRDRHIGAKADAYGIGEERVQLLDELSLGTVRVLFAREVDIPPALEALRPVLAHHEIVGRR